MMRDTEKIFAETLAGKLRNESLKTREKSFKINEDSGNYNLKARGNVNLSVEEMDYIAYCIEKNIENEQICNK